MGATRTIGSSCLERGTQRKGSEYSITPGCPGAVRGGECLGRRECSGAVTSGMRRNSSA